MRPEDVWKEFRRTGDIARAGRMILRMARELREDVEAYLKPPVEEAPKREYRPRKLRRGVALVPRILRSPGRYPLRGEIVSAFRWVERKVRTVVSSISLSIVSRWDLVAEIGRIRERIRSLRESGMRRVPLSELVVSGEDLVPTLISLLFMERDGEVELMQEKPFEEIYVVLSDERA